MKGAIPMEFEGRLCNDLLIEAESRILFCLGKHDSIKHKAIYSALSVSLDQLQHAQRLRDQWKKDLIVQMHQQLKKLPILDGKSRGAGEKSEPLLEDYEYELNRKKEDDNS